MWTRLSLCHRCWRVLSSVYSSYNLHQSSLQETPKIRFVHGWCSCMEEMRSSPEILAKPPLPPSQSAVGAIYYAAISSSWAIPSGKEWKAQKVNKVTCLGKGNLDDSGRLLPVFLKGVNSRWRRLSDQPVHRERTVSDWRAACKLERAPGLQPSWVVTVLGGLSVGQLVFESPLLLYVAPHPYSC